MKTMNPEQCTKQQRDAIALEAQRRQQFLLWLAIRLEVSDDPAYRMEAAKQLRQLSGSEA